MRVRIGLSAWLLAAILAHAGCGRTERVSIEVPGGDADRGADLIGRNGCGGCHRVPGVAGADGRVGPPLDHYAERMYVAGELVNTPDNLVRWIVAPQEINPGGGMPDLGISEEDARHMAAYLYTLGS